jgi:PAS domain-containing protein
VGTGNAAAATLLGVAPAALPGLAADEAHPHYDGFEFTEALTRVQHSGIAESRDALVLDRADPPTWHRLHFERLDGGEVLVEVSDISELVHARALRRIEDELAQFIVRSLPLTVLLVDESGRVLRCTSTAGNVFGNDRGALEEHDVLELFGAAGPECLAQITHTLNTGRIGIATFAIDAERSQWLECRTTLLRARPGMPPRVLLGVLDASHREQAAREARLALEQLRAAIASVPQALYLKDVEGRYIATNAAFDALMGVEGGMLLGKTDVEVFPDELATELHEAAQRLALSAEALTERRSVGTGGARATRLCCDFPLRGADGALLGHGGLWMDPGVLPLEGSDAPARVLDLEAHRTARAADLDHATASVINRVEDALTDSGDYAGVLRQLEQLVETTMQAQALIHHAAGQGGPARPLVALAPLAREIVELERILVPASARFENEIDNELPPAHCEPVAFHQILLRGIRHARRSLGARGSLCIRLRRSGGARRACIACHEGFEGAFVELVIEDSDSRLDDEDIARLVSETGIAAGAGGALDDLAEIHALSHAQGGHLQIHRNVPAGISVHVFFRAGEPAEAGDTLGTRRSTIARFPLGRTLGRGGN